MPKPVLKPCPEILPGYLRALLDLAETARGRRVRRTTGDLVRWSLAHLLEVAEERDTDGGCWARVALEQNATRAIAYLKAHPRRAHHARRVH